MAHMTTVACKCCRKKFEARTADVKRGWGKFCSKRCKAIEQEQRTGQHRNYLNSDCDEHEDSGLSQSERDHQSAMNDAEQGWDAHKGWC